MSETPQAAPAEPAVWRRLLWPAIVVGLLGGHVVIVSGGLLLSSTLIPAASTAPEGYQEALRWDELRAWRRDSEQLGWTLAVAVAADATLVGERTLEATLLDRGGLPVVADEFHLRMYHHATRARRSRPRSRRRRPAFTASSRRCGGRAPGGSPPA